MSSSVGEYRLAMPVNIAVLEHVLSVSCIKKCMCDMHRQSTHLRI